MVLNDGCAPRSSSSTRVGVELRIVSRVANSPEVSMIDSVLFDKLVSIGPNV